jgi:hypothetical protein
MTEIGYFLCDVNGGPEVRSYLKEELSDCQIIGLFGLTFYKFVLVLSRQTLRYYHKIGYHHVMTSYSQTLIVSSFTVMSVFNLTLYKSAFETPYLNNLRINEKPQTKRSLRPYSNLELPSANPDTSDFTVSVEMYSFGIKILPFCVKSRICGTEGTV